MTTIQDRNPEGVFIFSGPLDGPEGGAGLAAALTRCQRLRFTGTLEVLDAAGARLGAQTWLGGQALDGAPAVGSGARFLLSQRIPDLDGQLTAGVTLQGPLAEGTVERIAALCSEHQLCADVLLRNEDGDAASVAFTYGRAESAQISGETQMALLALAVLSSWAAGHFEVRLRPLFGADGPTEAPIFVEKNTRGRDFDLTGTMQVDRPVHRPMPSRPPLQISPAAPILERAPQDSGRSGAVPQAVPTHVDTTGPSRKRFWFGLFALLVLLCGGALSALWWSARAAQPYLSGGVADGR